MKIDFKIIFLIIARREEECKDIARKEEEKKKAGPQQEGGPARSDSRLIRGQSGSKTQQIQASEASLGAGYPSWMEISRP